MNQRLVSEYYGQTKDEFLAEVEAVTGFKAGTVEYGGNVVRGYLLQHTETRGWELITEVHAPVGGMLRRYHQLTNEQITNLPVLRSLGIEPKRGHDET